VDRKLKIGVYELSSLILIKVLSPLHIGIGRLIGIVDLPIARDGFKLPVIPASSLKGALRGCFDERAARIIFGPHPMEGEQYAGALAVLDGYLLAIPARSLRGVWALVTSGLLLKRLEQLTCIVGAKRLINEALWEKIKQLKENHVLVSSSGMEKFSFGNPPIIVLNEEFELEPIECQEVEQIASQLSVEEPWRLVIVHDDILRPLIERSIIRRTRVRLKPETKTVEPGALWTEEELPAETLFITCFLYSKARTPKQKEKLDADKIKQSVEVELFNKRKGYVIFGGHETIGRGLVKMSILSAG